MFHIYEQRERGQKQLCFTYFVEFLSDYMEKCIHTLT